MLGILGSISQADKVSGTVFKLVKANSLFDSIDRDVQVISRWFNTRDSIFKVLILFVLNIRWSLKALVLLQNSLILTITASLARALVTVDDLILTKRGIDGDSRAIFNDLVELGLWWKLTFRFEFLFDEIIILVEILNIFFNDSGLHGTRNHHIKIMTVVPELANTLECSIIRRGRLVEMFVRKRCILLTIGVYLVLEWVNLTKCKIINIDLNVNLLFFLVHLISLFHNI